MLWGFNFLKLFYQMLKSTNQTFLLSSLYNSKRSNLYIFFHVSF